ncbi:MAG: alpha/beta fold hydrolase [Verrucomicrobiae bacterium]|nr:alpha/beta fold hydrolase [Verrucomicrobiae bacterium]
MFLHGLGDHGGRHAAVLEQFVKRGIVCVAPDLPGHGLSDGQRGFIPSLDAVHSIISENLAWVRDQVGNPLSPGGLLGHSMGGFLSLDYLARYPDEFAFAWTSSPLIDARWNQSKWLQVAVGVLGKAIPRLSISSRVTSGACKRNPQRILETQRDKLVHRRLSVGLGRLLLMATAQIPGLIHRIHPDLRLLITHGSNDVICPSHLSRELFDQMPNRDKNYAHLEGLLHEPFNDIGCEAFFNALGQWLDRLDLTQWCQSVPCQAA